MADEWRSTDQEWHTWWGAAWQPIPRWLSALGTVCGLADSSSTVLVSVAFGRYGRDRAREDRCPVTGRTQLSSGCLRSDSQLGSGLFDSVCSVPFLRTRRFHSVILVHLATPARLYQEALQDLGPPPGCCWLLCWPSLSRPSPINADRWDAAPLLCSSRFAGPPGLPPPPALEVQHDHQVPFDLVFPKPKAKPPR